MNASTREENIKKLKEEIAKMKKIKAASLNNAQRVNLRQMIKELDNLEHPPSSSGVFVSEEEQMENRVIYVPISKITTNQTDVLEGELKDRSGVEEEKIKALSQSIKEVGLLQPVFLHALPDGTYRKIAGWRRIEATKMLGEKKIKAIVRYGELDLNTHNLSILHENTQREDLNEYDKVMAVLHFVKASLGVDTDKEARAVCQQSLNFKKGNIENITEGHEEKLKKVEQALSKTAVFSSLSSFVIHLQVLDMEKSILKFLNSNIISFNVAEALHRARKYEWKNGWIYENVIEYVGESQMTIPEFKVFLKANSSSGKKEDENYHTILSVFTTAKEKIKTLPKEKQASLKKELDTLLSAYLK